MVVGQAVEELVEKSTYLRLGDLESKDQVETALYMGSLPYVDKDNIGIWGVEGYGGFNTLMSMSEGGVLCSRQVWLWLLLPATASMIRFILSAT